MATGKAKSLDEMKMKELTETMEALGVSDEGVENLSDARSRIRSALNAAPKTSNWLPGKVRYFNVCEGFRTVTSLAAVHQCLSRGATFRDRSVSSTSNRYCFRPNKETGCKIPVLFLFHLFHVFHLCTTPNISID